MEAVQKGEQKIMCPYNPSHYIRRSRMECHLVKCRRDSAGKCQLVACDFNSCHRIPEPEIQYHHDHCPDKKSIEVALILEDEHCPLAPIAAPRVPAPCDDSWDDGPAVPSYDPNKYCLENNILRRIDTASAAVRKNFRIAERQRVEELAKQKKQDKEVTISRENRDARNIELPPTPQFKPNSCEQTPAEIALGLQEMKLRNIKPPVAVIPRQK